MSKPNELAVSPISLEIVDHGMATALFVRHVSFADDQPPLLCATCSTDLLGDSAEVKAAFLKLVEAIGSHIHMQTVGEPLAEFVHVGTTPTH